MPNYIKFLLKRVKQNFDLHTLLNFFKLSGSSSSRYEPIFDILLRDPQDNLTLTKHALFSYIVHPMRLNNTDPTFLTHINNWHTLEIIRILNSLGYIVDLIDYRDENFLVEKKYDLFIGHGGINYEKICRSLDLDAKKIYFSTGSYWKFHNEQEKIRVENLNKRRRSHLKPDRLIERSEEAAICYSDAIIGIGNKFVRRTYPFSEVFMVDTTTLTNNRYDLLPKDVSQSCKAYVYYAGAGCVHKGLDLLLEAFSGLEEELWVCSEVDYEFGKEYRRELFDTRNIHYTGWVQPRSKKYYQVMDNCSFTILPSCSEGGPGSVVECMNLGLIPVVSLASGIDVCDYGFIIEPSTISEIKKTVTTISNTPLETIESKSRKSREAARTRFSQTAFSENFTRALELVLSRNDEDEKNKTKNCKHN